jgi:hypothetical protein
MGSCLSVCRVSKAAARSKAEPMQKAESVRNHDRLPPSECIARIFDDFDGGEHNTERDCAFYCGNWQPHNIERGQPQSQPMSNRKPGDCDKHAALRSCYEDQPGDIQQVVNPDPDMVYPKHEKIRYAILIIAQCREE